MKAEPLIGSFQSNPFPVVKLIGLIAVLFLRCLPAYSQTPTGSQIFDRMLRVYADAKTYQDQGRLQTEFYKGEQTYPEWTQIKHFATAYNRATGQFCFWYEKQNESFFDLPDKYVIWRQGAIVHQWWTMNEFISQKETLAEALGTAAGVSGTTSRKIPELLLSEPIGAGWSIDSLTNIKLIGAETQGDRACYRLTGVFLKKNVANLWIDQRKFLLIRVDEEHALGKEKFKTSIRYQPLINKPIPADALTFEPPRVFWLWFRPVLKYGLIALVFLLWFSYKRSPKQHSLHQKQ